MVVGGIRTGKTDEGGGNWGFRLLGSFRGGNLVLIHFRFYKADYAVTRSAVSLCPQPRYPRPPFQWRKVPQ